MQRDSKSVVHGTNPADARCCMALHHIAAAPSGSCKTLSRHDCPRQGLGVPVGIGSRRVQVEGWFMPTRKRKKRGVLGQKEGLQTPDGF